MTAKVYPPIMATLRSIGYGLLCLLLLPFYLLTLLFLGPILIAFYVGWLKASGDLEPQAI